MSHIRDKHPSEELLQAFLDGDVSSRERRRVEEHVASCTRCTEELATWRVLFEDLDSLHVHRPSADFHMRVMSGVRLPEELPLAARLKERLTSLLPRARPGHLGEDVLQDLAEGALTSRQVARARVHLAGCEVCTAELESWTTVMARLSEVERLAPSAGFADRVITGMEQAGQRVSVAPASPAEVRRRSWARAVAAAKRFLPRTRRAWATIAGVAVTPAVTFGLVLWAVFSHPTLTPQALASFMFWQLSDLLFMAWSSLLSVGLAVSRSIGLDGFIEAVIDAPLMAAGAFALYAIAFTAASRVLYKNLIDRRSLRHRYASASAS